MKQGNSTKSSKTSKIAAHPELRDEDFAWLGEIHQVLSPYWSARSGYREGDLKEPEEPETTH